MLAAIEAARSKRPGDDDHLTVTRIIIVGFGPGVALGRLGMGVKKHAQDKERVRWELKSWIIEAALGRMGTRTLTEEQQREVWNATHKPETVAWPAWWSYRG